MKRKLLFIATLLCLGLTANAQWITQDPMLVGPDNVLNVFNVSAANQNVVWASLRGLGATPPTVQKYLRTVDGGNSWVMDTVTVAANHDFGNLFALNADTAWAAMYAAAGGGGLFRTFNGGVTWVKATTGAQFPAPAGFPNVVYFFDSNNGFAMGDPVGGYFEIYTTSNAGTTWTRVPTGNIPAELSGEYGIVNLYSVIGNTIWFGTNKGRVYKSVDRGLNWTVSNAGLQYINDVVFSDANNGYVTQNDTLKASTDGGVTWTMVNKKGKFYSGDDLAYVPNSGNPGVLVSSGTFRPYAGAKYEYGSSFSKDGGLTWYPLADPSDSLSHNGLAFVDSTTGFSGGFHHIAPDTNIVDQTIMLKWNGGFAIPSNLTYTINSSAGANGAISPSGSITAPYGSDHAFTITPNTGFVIDSLIVDGLKLVSSPTYSFNNVVKNHSIRVTFKMFVGVNEAADVKNNIILYPNPASSKLNVNFGGSASRVTARLYDIVGKTVKTVEMENNGSTMTVEIADLQTGTYFIEMTDGKTRGIAKFTKE